MVDFIDIHKLTLEELSGVVDIYPWYGGARMELCRRMAELGALSESQIARTALHALQNHPSLEGAFLCRPVAQGAYRSAGQV